MLWFVGFVIYIWYVIEYRYGLLICLFVSIFISKYSLYIKFKKEV